MFLKHLKKMASNIHKLFSTLLLLSTIILFSYPAPATPQECQYPCFPPPGGPGNNPPATTTPPAPPVSTTPPGGFSPFTPPPPYYFGAAPPPPDPILPWYPYYYRRPPHKDQSSSGSVLGESRSIVVFVFPLFLVFCFAFH